MHGYTAYTGSIICIYTYAIYTYTYAIYIHIYIYIHLIYLPQLNDLARYLPYVVGRIEWKLYKLQGDTRLRDPEQIVATNKQCFEWKLGLKWMT